MKALLNLLEELEKAELIANEAEGRYEENPENEELEKAFDKAYETEYNLRKSLAEMVMEE